jgi:hypothetical protein
VSWFYSFQRLETNKYHRLMEIAAMSFACRELRNRKYLKISNLSNYMKDVDSKLQALTEAVARLEQRAGTLPPHTIQISATETASRDNAHDPSALPGGTHPEMEQV